MESSRLEALLEAVRAVQESVSELEREIMSALAQDRSTHEPSASLSAPTPDEAPEWLTVADLAVWLKVSRTIAYELVSSREIPSYRIGRSIRVRRTEVEWWLEENRYELGG